MDPQTLAYLERFPALLAAHLDGLPPALLDRDEGPGTWTIREVVAHLADLETNAWLHRVEFILRHGPTQPLPAIDREAFRLSAPPHPLAHFTAQRAQNLRALRLTPADTLRQGLHPSLGIVTVAQLLATWATHDLTHLAQITRILAARHRDAVGPWRAYLSVLRPPR